METYHSHSCCWWTYLVIDVVILKDKVMINETTQLSIEDGKIFLDILQDNSEPNEVLINAALQYASANTSNHGGDAG